ncbi:sigma-70 family RNA polymerase sigma factor [Brucella pseudogrignonensis]|uniref:RNA polymerase sigma factor n=1 Tax=Brucella pseudogrignonensis TaxID=419475 RepID=UPI001E55D5BF|nr:sigma-70 family RNA polymerase sigma factor [Brucella pseudogrignonensis]MCD4512167.1 sigma-70 family RNA polymerase sigma factor [Brucella pseudogrignonensis]
MAGWRKKVSSLFAVHHERLESLVCKRVRDREAAADIVQDVFARALAAGPRMTEEDDRRVLYASTRNATVEHYRSQKRRTDIVASLVPEQLAPPVASPEAGLEARQALHALDDALSQLSPRCREIFILRRIEGLSNAEIADRYGISVNGVEKHIARALRHCQQCLSGHIDRN